MKVLCIAYHFPPVGGPGAQRSLNVARHLAERGADVTVITGSGASTTFWTPKDDANHELVSAAGIRVLRLEPDTAEATSLRRRHERWFAGSTAFGDWFEAGVWELVQQLPERPDVILGLLVPYDTWRAVSSASEELDVPWVADLLDPWALDEMWLYPTLLQRSRDRGRMHRALSSAGGVIMNTPEAARRVKEAFPSLAGRVNAISSGFEAGDFNGGAPRHPTDEFRIVHAGSFHTEFALRQRRTQWLRRALGGMPVPDVDFMTRSHVYLLRAVQALVTRNPALRDTVRVHLAGAMTDIDELIARSYAFTELRGFLTHPETAALIRSADLLFLPMHNLNGRAGLVPTKTYEYLASGRPVLAAVPAGDARDILEQAGTATITAPNDVAMMSTAIERRYEQWSRGDPEPALNHDVIDRFEYRRLTTRIEAVLEGVVEARARRS